MIRLLKGWTNDEETRYAEFAGLSLDTKPKAGLITGSKFTEVDTGDVYLFDEEGSGTWTKVAAGWVDPEA